MVAIVFDRGACHVLDDQKNNKLSKDMVKVITLLCLKLTGLIVLWVIVLQVDTYMENDLKQSLEIYRLSSEEDNRNLKDQLDAVQNLVNNQWFQWKEEKTELFASTPISDSIFDTCIYPIHDTPAVNTHRGGEMGTLFKGTA